MKQTPNHNPDFHIGDLNKTTVFRFIYLIPLLALVVYLLPSIKENNRQEENSNQKPILTITPEPILINKREDEGQAYLVTKVIDGDTINLLIDGRIEKVRLIGVDSPELDSKECFATEAYIKAKELLTGKKVKIETDSSQDNRDRYQRLLRFVFLEDMTNFNLLMVKLGFAKEYTYDKIYKYQSEFKQAQSEAQRNSLGLWGQKCQTGDRYN